jgi:glycosyltransferase involved in cell wall biosynthesis
MVVACIPCRDEEAHIGAVLVETLSVADKVYVFDDRSTDHTAAIAKGLGATVITDEHDSGKGAGLRRLLSVASAEHPDAVIVTLDGDGQHDPREIPKLTEPILRGEADVVFGVRNRLEIPAERRLGNMLLGGSEVDAQCGLRAYRADIISRILPAEMGMGADAEIAQRVIEAGLRYKTVPVSVSYKRGGDTSTHSPAFHFLDVLFSEFKLLTFRHPLAVYGGLGLVFLALALVFAFAFGTLSVLLAQGMGTVVLALVGLELIFTGILLFTLISFFRRSSASS